ncbi:16S rRNA (cytidine(1402)-2'-O)-methyltransferase [Candidatus Poribacteria bacterium]|nr:MAG: 16S rRNA (cytidine(1402)-2'-O)-methyltransferase [Candidatus Poribacteria bacterium]
MSGTLYVVATPIGNLEDITLRALRVLREVDLIAAEDTRHTKKLLDHYGIRKPMVSYHEHNERERAEQLVRELKKGKDVALVTDAGTPAISDPGYVLIRRCIEEGVKVVPVPGPSALIAALCVSGLPVHRFAFEGFLPHKGGKRRNKLEELKDEERTLIFYESPHRLLKTLKDMLEILGDRNIAVARELTKVHEEVFRGRISEAIKRFSSSPVKGEITLVVEGKKD